MEKFEKEPVPGPTWVRPNFNKERGEIERVTKDFLELELTAENIFSLQKTLEAAPIVQLSESEWSALENTDSFHEVAKGDIEGAAKIIEDYNATLDPQYRRDFHGLLAKMQSGKEMEMPAIVRKSGKSHLVSGNTRLMICRALSYQPSVVLADIP